MAAHRRDRVFVGELTKLRWVFPIAAVIIAAAIIGWNWPSPPDMTEREEASFEREHGVAVNAGGSVVVARWAMSIAVLVVGIAFGSLLLSYFYLRLQNPRWPLPGIAEPTLGWAGLAESDARRGATGATTASTGTPFAVDISGDRPARVIWAAFLAGPVILMARRGGALRHGAPGASSLRWRCWPSPSSHPSTR